MLQQLHQAANDSHLFHEREDSEDMYLSCQSPVIVSRTDSLRSTSSFRRDSSFNASECSSSGMKQIIRKASQRTSIAGHDSNSMESRVLEEVEHGFKNKFREEGRECAREFHEFQDLANCLHGGRALRKNKLQKLLCITGVASACDFIANPRRIFQSKNGCPGHPCAREVAAVSKKGLFSGCFAPFVDGALPQLGSPSQQQTRPIFQFTKVESTQRDFPAWTMEEYMTKNGRIQEWMYRKDDGEFGGIEGNNLMSHYLDDDIVNSDDTDSD